MTDTQTPERIWLTWEGPHEADHWFSLEAYSFDCPEQHEFIRLDLHAAVVAERDQLKAEVQKLEEILHAHDFYRQQEEEAQFEEERQQLENLEMERHFRENPHG